MKRSNHYEKHNQYNQNKQGGGALIFGTVSIITAGVLTKIFG